MQNEPRKFTLDELKQYDGLEGRSAYVAYQGNVFDVTESFLWIEGDHQGQHVAGKDLTNELKFAPHGEETLARVKQVGVLVSESEK